MDLEINNNQNKNTIPNDFSNELKKHLQKVNNTFSVDRFEGEFAVCENRQTGELVNIPKNLLPNNCKQGSILKFENGIYTLDLEETQKEQEEIKNLVNNLFKKK